MLLLQAPGFISMCDVFGQLLLLHTLSAVMGTQSVKCRMLMAHVFATRSAGLMSSSAAVWSASELLASDDELSLQQDAGAAADVDACSFRLHAAATSSPSSSHAVAASLPSGMLCRRDANQVPRGCGDPTTHAAGGAWAAGQCADVLCTPPVSGAVPTDSRLAPPHEDQLAAAVLEELLGGTATRQSIGSELLC